MAIIECSPAFAALLPARLFTEAEGSASAASRGLMYNSNGITDSNTQIRIYKGAAPSSLSSPTDRSADILITFPAGPTASKAVTVTATSSQVIVDPYIPVAAAASGVASWFAILHFYNSSLYHHAIGTVGVTGSGADLEIPDVNIVAGVVYNFGNLIINVPSSWTY